MSKKSKLKEVGRFEVRDYIHDYEYVREWLSAMEQSGATVFVALRKVKKSD